MTTHYKYDVMVVDHDITRWEGSIWEVIEEASIKWTDLDWCIDAGEGERWELTGEGLSPLW